MTRPIPPLDLAILMRDDVALAALCDDRPDLFHSSQKRANRSPTVDPSPDTGARKSGTFSTLSTLLLWIVIAAGYGVLAAGWL